MSCNENVLCLFFFKDLQNPYHQQSPKFLNLYEGFLASLDLCNSIIYKLSTGEDYQRALCLFLSRSNSLCFRSINCSILLILFIIS